ncbi:ABC transporter substrate-binding protein [Ventosimonas gracilis]|uniref:ABC transporter substrate-binding protein n=1 Tax=Ventosimonas gracilis TaxID=1680762 RepID=A0A139SVZ3_9GAMM|nr:spermidine/putrescine ABC transporter substrate-binding protein [Ventosimonas gracilis]KXU38738.1 ABC transporter substrate-binding protein [Ventosimonas gracilis]
MKPLLTTTCFSALAVFLSSPALAQNQLNALVWCDHTDPALIEPFEKAHGVKVNLKEYSGTGEGISIIEQSRSGDWDVLVVDTVDILRLADMDLLAELPESALPLADIFPELLMPKNTRRDGKIYGITEKFGYNTLSYNKNKVNIKDMDNIQVILSPAYKNRIALYDYYLPLIGLTGIALGKPTAELTLADLPAIRSTLFEMKKNARQVSDVVAAQTALATGEVDIVVGGGEWLTAALSVEMPELDWTIPEQGALLWSQALAIFKDSKKPELAIQFVQYILSPEGQARLATSSCYWAMPSNNKAADYLTAPQKQVLRWDSQSEYLKKAQLYPLIDADLDEAMQDIWTEMLQQ